MARMPKNTAPGLGARNTASTFDAIQNALNLYLKLKDKESDDAIKQREMTRQEGSATSQSKYYDALSANMGEDNRRAEQDAEFKKAAQLADLYGGTRIPAGSSIPERFDKAGYPKELAFTPEMTLPASRLPGSMSGMPQGPSPSEGIQGPQAAPQMPQGPPQYFSPAPQAETGAQIMNPTESSKLRATQAGIASREGIAATAEQGRNDRAAAARAQREAALAQNASFRKVSQELQRLGLNKELAMLQEQLLRDSNTADRDTFSMQLRLFEAATKGGNDLSAILKTLNDPTGQVPPTKPVVPPMRRPIVPAVSPTPNSGGLDPNRFDMVVH